MEAGSKKKTPKRAVIAVAIVILAAIALFIWILFSATSPLASIHDADGDGHPDANDAAPNNPLLWAKGSATIEFTLYSIHSSTFHYTLSVNGIEKAYGNLPAWSSVKRSITVDFLYGVSDHATVTGQWTSVGPEFVFVPGQFVQKSYSGQFSVSLTNGEIHPFTLFV